MSEGVGRVGDADQALVNEAPAGLHPTGFDPSRVFAQMDRYLEEAVARRYTPKFFRVSESLIRDLSTGTARISSYRDIPFHCADEWAWGWMLRVYQGMPWVESWFEPRDSDGSSEAGETHSGSTVGDSAGRETASPNAPVQP